MKFTRGALALTAPLPNIKPLTAMDNPSKPLEHLKDPICGMAVTDKSFHFVEKEGRMYYFCGAKCRGRFLAQSGLSLAGLEARTAFPKGVLQGILPVLRKVQPLWWFLLCAGLVSVVMVMRQLA